LKHSFAPSLEKRERADLCILPFWEGPQSADDLGPLKDLLRTLLAAGDFKGKKGEGTLVYPEEEKEARFLLLGLGKVEEASPETLRRAFASAVKTARGKKAKRINVLFPKCRTLSREEAIRGVWEGILLANYVFDELKGDTRKDSPPPLEHVSWIGLERKDEAWLGKLQTIAESVYFARDLVNGNADDVIPRKLADAALSLEKISPKVKTSVYDRKWLAQKKMGLILAVSRASSYDPFLIQASYKGNPRSKDHIVLIGKGVTYDTGGLSLKPTDNMLSMKSDMAAAAAVLGAVRAAAALGLKINATALAPAVENAIGSKSYKPGDVYSSYSGKTVEISNTDAEGRLILADALAYSAESLKATCTIDLATLTGAMIIALGEEISGVFTRDEKLANELAAASDRTSELVWRMPLHTEYRDSLKSDYADLQSVGGREAGAMKAALFLEEFADKGSWAHIDIAGPTFLNKPKHYHPTKATGYGVRLLVEFLEKRAAK
jgi:leucyl aminopeptidase